MGRNRDKHTSSSHNNTGSKVAKLDFPKYNGMDDHTSLICKVEQYFDLKQIRDRDSYIWQHFT
jgi:hypothetical protein